MASTNTSENASENLIEQHILEWFWENNTLMLPKIGNFQTQYQHAQLTSANGEILPPHQTLKFEYDGQAEESKEFVQFVAQKTGFGKQASQNLLREYIGFVQYDLNVKKKYTILGVGTLLANPDGTLSFQPQLQEYILADSFGLEPIKVTPIRTEVPYKNPDLSASLPTEETVKKYPQENTAKENTTKENISKENVNNASKTQQNIGEKPTKTAENTYKTPINTPTEKIPLSQNTKVENTKTTNIKSETAVLAKELNLPATDEIVEQEEVVPIHKQLYFWIAVVVFLVCATFALLLMTDTQIFGKKQKNDVVIKEPDDSKEIAENEKNKKETESKNNEKDTQKSNGKPTVNEKGDVMELLKMPNVSLREEFATIPEEPANLDKILVTTPEKRHFIIVASFDNAPRAYSYYNNMVKFGFEMVKILKPSPQNPKFRVSVADYSDKKLARLRNLEFDKKYRVQSWILLY